MDAALTRTDTFEKRFPPTSDPSVTFSLVTAYNVSPPTPSLQPVLVPACQVPTICHRAEHRHADGVQPLQEFQDQGEQIVCAGPPVRTVGELHELLATLAC